mmetsp:Transcript_23606/g.34699  ORF Transcript_23606/g.34699 Transcript_23606/m.34699 type:complete len:459 (-) Transcript_23606:596-1972(-)
MFRSKKSFWHNFDFDFANLEFRAQSKLVTISLHDKILILLANLYYLGGTLSNMSSCSDENDYNKTTLYIEDITCDDNNERTSNNEIHGVELDMAVSKYEKMKNTNGKAPNEELCNAWISNELATCPHSIGGGATIASVMGKFYVFGGCDRSGEPSALLMQFQPESNEWTELSCTGTSPSARFGHTAIAQDSFLYIFGGQGLTYKNGTSLNKATPISYNDTYCLDTRSLSWSAVNSNESESDTSMNSTIFSAKEDKQEIIRPLPRNSHSAVVMENKMVIFGGANSETGPMNDAWAFDLNLHIWERIEYPTNMVPEKREMHTACVLGSNSCCRASSCMYIVGGRREDGEVCQDLWVLDSANFEWNKLASPPSPRCSHGTVMVPKYEYLCCFGGWDGKGTIYDDLVVFDLKSGNWKEIHLSDNPQQRFGHTCCNRGEDGFVIFGGVNMNSDLNDLHIISTV